MRNISINNDQGESFRKLKIFRTIDRINAIPISSLLKKSSLPQN